MTQNKIEVPDEQNPVWNKLVTGAIKLEFDFMATKILLIRIHLDLNGTTDPTILTKSIEELRQMFLKNIRNPRVQNDTRKLLGEGTK